MWIGQRCLRKMEIVGVLHPAKHRPVMTLDEKLVPVDPTGSKSLNGQLLLDAKISPSSLLRHKMK
jgi:hypothetical protein